MPPLCCESIQAFPAYGSILACSETQGSSPENRVCIDADPAVEAETSEDWRPGNPDSPAGMVPLGQWLSLEEHLCISTSSARC